MHSMGYSMVRYRRPFPCGDLKGKGISILYLYTHLSSIIIVKPPRTNSFNVAMYLRICPKARLRPTSNIQG